jgi:NTP pyrophosphatase (non-canonical NTP hydrolase)
MKKIQKRPMNWIEGMAMELKDKQKMKDKLQELMTITMEECGELIQECSKAIRCDNYYDNTELLQEVSDVYCMLELMHEYDLISWNDVDILVERKKEKLKKWSGLLDD